MPRKRMDGVRHHQNLQCNSCLFNPFQLFGHIPKFIFLQLKKTDFGHGLYSFHPRWRSQLQLGTTFTFAIPSLAANNNS